MQTQTENLLTAYEQTITCNKAVEARIMRLQKESNRLKHTFFHLQNQHQYLQDYKQTIVAKYKKALSSNEIN